MQVDMSFILPPSTPSTATTTRAIPCIFASLMVSYTPLRECIVVHTLIYFYRDNTGNRPCLHLMAPGASARTVVHVCVFVSLPLCVFVYVCVQFVCVHHVYVCYRTRKGAQDQQALFSENNYRRTGWLFGDVRRSD